MKYLVTGATGFIGRHLAAFLEDRGHTVTAASRSIEKCDLPIKSKCSGTVLSRETVNCWIEETKPDVVLHLAAQSLPRVSWEDPAGTYQVNINGTMNLLTAIHEQEHPCRFVMFSSSSVYAPSPDGAPIREDGRLGGSSPYALSKLAAEQGTFLYGKHHGIDVVSVRPFFITGPQKLGDVSSDFARRIVAVERGEEEKITVGNLEAVRDFLDINDAVKGIARVVEKGDSGEAYNICSGKGVSIRELLDTMKSCAKVEITEEVDSSLMRPIDEPVKIGDPAKLAALGWNAEVPFEESIKSVLEFWRNRS